MACWDEMPIRCRERKLVRFSSTFYCLLHFKCIQSTNRPGVTHASMPDSLCVFIGTNRNCIWGSLLALDGSSVADMFLLEQAIFALKFGCVHFWKHLFFVPLLLALIRSIDTCLHRPSCVFSLSFSCFHFFFLTFHRHCSVGVCCCLSGSFNVACCFFLLTISCCSIDRIPFI